MADGAKALCERAVDAMAGGEVERGTRSSWKCGTGGLVHCGGQIDRPRSISNCVLDEDNFNTVPGHFMRG